MKGCIGLDTNVLARYYVDDAADAEAAAQRARDAGATVVMDDCIYRRWRQLTE